MRVNDVVQKLPNAEVVSYLFALYQAECNPDACRFSRVELRWRPIVRY